MALFDNTFLCLLFHPEAKPPNDASGKPVSRCRERIDQLVSELEANHSKIIIPTPALTELLVLAGPKYVEYLNEINGRACFKVVDFDQRAAIEAALRMATAKAAGDKRSGTDAEYQKVKFDRQIVAIAKVEGIKRIYSDDGHVKKLGEECGITVVRLEELPLPPPKQTFFEGMKDVKTETPNVPSQTPDPIQAGGIGHPKSEAGTERPTETNKK
jgi:hypothetical protein